MLSKTYDAAINLFRNEIQDVEDVQELSDAEYNRRFGKFFPKPDEEREEINSSSGFYISRIQAAAHGALSGPLGGGKGVLSLASLIVAMLTILLIAVSSTKKSDCY
ncbi:MAG: hypothetical protein Q7U57_00225 [Methylovulum sp.]|nr:hypothetical protein [Methylovulum sp.]